MTRNLIFTLFVFFLVGCGKTSHPSENREVASPSLPSSTTQQSDQTPQKHAQQPASVTPQQAEETLSQIKHDAENIVPVEESKSDQVVTQSPEPLPATERSVTVYIHGYDDKGVTYDNSYGYDAYDPILDKLVQLTGFDTLQTYDPDHFTNLITLTPYYGKKPPAYYTPEDIAEVEAVTERYGGGIPRYALIVAKYARHVMQLTGARKVNFISASMGSLVARWIIEKDLEHLAGEGSIVRWQTLEGVIRGNRIASQRELVEIATQIQKQPIDVQHMSYKWIERNLHNPAGESDSPYYSGITISQISSTKQGKPFGWLIPDIPNDGYQAVVDTYFSSLSQVTEKPTHTYFHRTHLGLKKYDGAWANVATFLLPHKRVTITLTGASVYNLHESGNPFNKNAEVVFESRIYSPVLLLKWGIDDAVSEQLYDGGILPVHRYKKRHTYKAFKQVLYDDYLLEEEQEVMLKMAAYEVDQSLLYHVHDGFGRRDTLGETTLTIPLRNGDYTITAREWSGTIHVEVER